jgi:EcsC protein family
MNSQEAAAHLSPTHRRALRAAYLILERPDVATVLGNLAGGSIEKVRRRTPRALEARVTRTIEAALQRALALAIRSLGDKHMGTAALAGASGAVSGFFGPAALAVELPVATTLILRSIAEVARRHGEDLASLETRLQCIAVLGLDAKGARNGADAGYFAARATLSRLIADATTTFVERGAAAGAAPSVNAIAASVAPRFGLVVSERAAATALPALGALGGATLNMLFVRHFQRIAHGHFTIRRLERLYGAEAVSAYYNGLRLVRPGRSRR